MLNKKYILKQAEKYVSTVNEISCEEFNSLWGNLAANEQVEIADILEEHMISIVEEKQVCLEQELLGRVDSHRSKGYDNLSNEDLCVLYKKGDRGALDALAVNNKRFVYQIAKKLSNQLSKTNFTFDDIVQEGFFGLMKAADHFDAAEGIKFTTYSWYWIRQSILRHAVDNGFLVRIPVHMYDKLNRLNIIRSRHPEADIDDLARLMTERDGTQKYSQADIIMLLGYTRQYMNTTSLNLLMGEDSDTELLDLVEDDKNAKPEDAVTDSELADLMKELLDTLTDREKSVIRQRFGFDDGSPKTLEEVGKYFGVSRERIRQIEVKALRKLRHPSRARRIVNYL